MPLIAAAIRLLLPALARLLTSKLGYAIAAALLWFGIGLTTYSFALGPTFDAITSLASGVGSGEHGELGVKALQWAGVMRLDQAITMWIGAIATRVSLTNTRLFLTKVTPGGGS